MAVKSFFSQTPLSQVKEQVPEYTFIPVGGEQFHALSVALIDGFKSFPHANEAFLKKVLERFFAYYPKFIPTQQYLTPADRMGLLVNSSRKSEIVECMAYVLRQLVVDEIYANPLNYRQAFDGLSSQTPKDYLRQMNTVLPANCLSALAKALGIKLSLSFTEHGKELRDRKIYNYSLANSPEFKMVIQIQDADYFPGVKNKADFAYVGQLAVSPLKPSDAVSHQTGTVAEILELIATDNKRLLVSYDQRRKTLMSMVAAGELTKEPLIILYIEFLPKNHASLNSTSHFFSGLEHVKRKPVVADPVGSGSQLIELLAKTLAGWMSVGEANAEKLFERIDNGSSSTLTR